MNYSIRGIANLVKIVTGHLATVIVLTASSIIIPRLLGVEAFGRYSAILAIVAILQATATGGLQQVELRYLAPMWRNKSKNSVILASTIWSARLVMSIISGVIAAFFLKLSQSLEIDQSMMIILGFFCCLRGCLQSTRSLFLPLGHAGTASVIEIMRVTITLATVVVFYDNPDLYNVFLWLTFLLGLLLSVSIFMLLSIIPIRLDMIKLTSLLPYLKYSISSFLGMSATIAHSQFPVYAVATWSAPRDAGILAVSVQLYILARGLFLSARRSVMPILAELEENGEIKRLSYWGEIIMRYSTFGGCIFALGWAFFGRDTIRFLLTEAFAPAYYSAYIIILGTILFFCGASCVGLLYTRGFAGAASISSVIYASVTIIGVLLVLQWDTAYAVSCVSWLFVISSAIYWFLSHTLLSRYAGIDLCVSRTIMLALPAVIVWPFASMEMPVSWSLVLFVIVLSMYILYVFRLRILPYEEVRMIALASWKAIDMRN